MLLLCRERQRLRRDARRGKDAAVNALAAEVARPPFAAAAPPTALGAVSESFADSLVDYLEDNPDGLLKDKVRHIKLCYQYPLQASAHHTCLCRYDSVWHIVCCNTGASLYTLMFRSGAASLRFGLWPLRHISGHVQGRKRKSSEEGADGMEEGEVDPRSGNGFRVRRCPFSLPAPTFNPAPLPSIRSTLRPLQLSCFHLLPWCCSVTAYMLERHQLQSAAVCQCSRCKASMDKYRMSSAMRLRNVSFSIKFFKGLCLPQHLVELEKRPCADSSGQGHTAKLPDVASRRQDQQPAAPECAYEFA